MLGERLFSKMLMLFLRLFIMLFLMILNVGTSKDQDAVGMIGENMT